MPLTDLSNPDILLRENWGTHLSYGADGTPLLPSSFVAELGPRVWIVDLREAEDLVGPGPVQIPIDEAPTSLQCGDVAREGDERPIRKPCTA